VKPVTLKPPALKLDAAEIGRRVKTRRIERNLSQEDVAAACGLSQNSVGKIEQGRTENSRFITQIWAYLGLDLGELSDLYSPPKPLSAAGNEQLTMIEVSLLRKVHLIKEITYEVVRMPDVGSGHGILISWIAKNGASISAVLDQAMISQASAQFFRCARELGIDLAKLPPEQS
jgi:transcriptional regulator with XRE-family HTH domain